ncbi:MAG: hypothetical protein ACR2FY_23630 [Pirellulaceae bacterium]
MANRISSSTLHPTRQEKATGFLSATLLLLGVVTLLLGAAWLSQQPRNSPTATRVSLRRVNEGAAGSSGTADIAKNLEDLGTQEQPPLTEQAAGLLQSVAALATTELSSLEDSSGSAKGTSGNTPNDGREVGPGGPGGPVIPAWQRWQIHYAASDLDEYASILDAFGVELGVMGGGDSAMDYARNLSQSLPLTRLGSLQPDSRLRFVIERGELKAADRALARKAGLSIDDRVVCQFFPDAVKQQLEILEREAMGSRPLATVRRTVFGIRKTGNGREFFVERVEPSLAAGGFAPL